MPELRTRSIQEAGAIPNVRQGFWIRTAASAAAVPQPKQARRVTAVSYKENAVIGPRAGTGRRRASPRRSPLPAWYPRAPLRDITNIVQALERRNARMRRDALARRLNHETETSPESEVVEDSPLFQEPYTFEHTPPGDVLPADTSDSSTLTDVTLSPVSPSQYSQDTHCSAICSSSDQPYEIESVTSLSPKDDMQTNEYERKLGNSIDEIEKAVMGDLKKPTKVAAKKVTRALMSMR